MKRLQDQTERRHGEPARRAFRTAGERLLAEGRAEEARRILEQFLRRKFGSLPAETAARLHAAPLETLELWLERVLPAQAIEDVFEPEPPP